MSGTRKLSVNATDFNGPIYVSPNGKEFFKKPGRPKLLSAEQAALLFALQVEKRAAARQIEKLLDRAGVPTDRGCRYRILAINWGDRGRVDVPHPSKRRAQP